MSNCTKETGSSSSNCVSTSFWKIKKPYSDELFFQLLVSHLSHEEPDDSLWPVSIQQPFLMQVFEKYTETPLATKNQPWFAASLHWMSALSCIKKAL